MRRHCGSSYSFALLIAVTLLGGATVRAQDDAAVLKDFQQRVSKYQSLKNQQDLPNKQTNSPTTLAEQKREAVEKLHAARPAARQGDIFTPEIASYFKKQIQATLHGPDGKKVEASLRRAEPVPSVHLQVNAKYPPHLPLQSTPPTLLLNLPQLPKTLQYRVVGSDLVLYDETSNLVVDFITGAISGPIGKK